MTNLLAELLDQDGTVLIDGAMGTQLFALGLNAGAPPERWNVTEPEKIAAVHRSYIEAGSRLILTNTFGGTAYRLKLHDLQDQAYAFNKASAEVARSVVNEFEHDIVVAGSIGPSGEILAPMGMVTDVQAADAFLEQARGLADGGVDVFWIETMSDIREVAAAVEGIRKVSDKPICATMTFDTKGRTMMGVTPQQAVHKLTELGIFAIGANCGNGVDEIEAVISQMHAEVPDAILIAKSNAGIPQWINNSLVYDGTPAVMADYAQRVRRLGAKIVGGCCGSAPVHISAMAEALSKPIDESAPPIEARGYLIEPPVEGEQAPKRRRRRRRS